MDEEISTHSLYFWFILQDSLTSFLSSPSITQESFSGESKFKLKPLEEKSRLLFARLVKALNKKVEYPNEEAWDKWPKGSFN